MNARAALLLLSSLALRSVAQAPQPSFDVASIRLSPADHGFSTISPPGAAEFRVTTVSMLFLLSMAFDRNADQIANAPTWAESTLYDVSAKAEGDTPINYKQLEPFLQTLLRDRFHLQSHFEKREINGYALVVAKGGSKLQRPTGPAPASNATTASIYSEGLRGASIPIKTLASMLRSSVGSLVIDATGLAGNFDVTLKFSNPQTADSDSTSDPTLPSIFTAVTEQLGLRLNSQKISLDFLVIDHIDKLPTPN